MSRALDTEARLLIASALSRVCQCLETGEPIDAELNADLLASRDAMKQFNTCYLLWTGGPWFRFVTSAQARDYTRRQDTRSRAWTLYRVEGDGEAAIGRNGEVLMHHDATAHVIGSHAVGDGVTVAIDPDDVSGSSQPA